MKILLTKLKKDLIHQIFEVNRPLFEGKNKKQIWLMKDELGGKIVKKFVALRPKTYSCLVYNGKKAKEEKG